MFACVCMFVRMCVFGYRYVCPVCLCACVCMYVCAPIDNFARSSLQLTWAKA